MQNKEWYVVLENIEKLQQVHKPTDGYRRMDRYSLVW